jgi:hypothetical protein
MILQKEEKLVAILLFMALGSLAVAYWAFGYGDDDGLSSSSARETIEGSVLGIKETRTGGNLIIQLDSTNMSIFVPSSSGAEQLSKTVGQGDRIRVAGEVSDYQGQKEILVRSSRDVEVISSAVSS